MKLHSTIATYMTAATGTVDTVDTMFRIRQQARSGDFQSIIVLNGNKPVGTIRWTEINHANGIPETTLARDIMLANSQVLTPATSVQEAQSSLDITDLDRLPVVDAQGQLIGVLNRDTLKVATSMKDGKPAHRLHDQPTVQNARRAFTVHPGMTVVSAEMQELGLVDRLFLDNGVVIGFMVSYGDDNIKHKQLPFDRVDHLEDQTIVLSVDSETFESLPDAVDTDL